MEQYNKPMDVRHYDLPTENYESKLYFEKPHLAKPVYRGLFRDKPHTVTSYHPGGIDVKPKGFHGRLYYEQENPRFQHGGRAKNDLYWLERQPYAPTYPGQAQASWRNDDPCMPQMASAGAAFCSATVGKESRDTGSSVHASQPAHSGLQNW